MIFLSSIGGTYLETNIIQKLNLNFPIFSQDGLSEWLLLNCSNKISDLTDFDIILSQTVFRDSFISIILFVIIFLDTIYR